MMLDLRYEARIATIGDSTRDLQYPPPFLCLDNPYKTVYYMGHMAYVKKTIELDEQTVKKVRKIFDVKTDKEAVNRALRLVADENDIIKTHEALGGSVELDSMFE